MSQAGLVCAAFWSICGEFRYEYENANTEEEKKIILLRVAKTLKNEPLRVGKKDKNGKLVLVGDDELVDVAKDYFEAPEGLKDAFENLIQKLGPDKSTKFFKLLGEEDKCAFVFFCSMKREVYLRSADPKCREWVKQRILSSAKQANLRLSKFQEDGSILRMGDEELLEKIPEFMYEFDDEEIKACLPLIGNRRQDQLIKMLDNQAPY